MMPLNDETCLVVQIAEAEAVRNEKCLAKPDWFEQAGIPCFLIKINAAIGDLQCCRQSRHATAPVIPLHDQLACKRARGWHALLSGWRDRLHAAALVGGSCLFNTAATAACCWAAVCIRFQGYVHHSCQALGRFQHRHPSTGCFVLLH